MQKNKRPENKTSIFTFFKYKPQQYPNYKSLNHIWVWDDRDALWFRYDKNTDELLNAYASLAVQDIPDYDEIKSFLISKELEDRIIGKINDMIGEKGLCYSVSREDLKRQKEKKENDIEDYVFFTDRLGRKTIASNVSLENRFDYIWIHSVKDNEWWLYRTKDNESQALKEDFDYECALEKLGVDELSINEKKQIVNSIKILKDKYTQKKCKKENDMPPTMNKVKVVPKSEKHTRTDIERALNDAYDDYGYVLDFKKEDDEYVYLYFKEKDLQ